MTRHKKLLFGFGILFTALIAGGVYFALQSRPVTRTTNKSQSITPEAAQPTIEDQPQQFNKKQNSIDDPASIWIVSNKKRSLPANYAPVDLVSTSGGQQLRSEAATALQSLVSNASADNVPLKAISGYRSYAKQQVLYNNYVQQDGVAKADTYSARPGFSEHQTGLAMDIGNSGGQCDLEICFGQTSGGKWVAANAYKYGFTVRYKETKTLVTGYSYEPWHLRYVGKGLAAQLQVQTMEEFFNLPAAPAY